jgi:hypothetical protein
MELTLTQRQGEGLAVIASDGAIWIGHGSTTMDELGEQAL